MSLREGPPAGPASGGNEDVGGCERKSYAKSWEMSALVNRLNFRP